MAIENQNVNSTLPSRIIIMPTAYVEEVLPFTAHQAFDLVHDYDRRLEWDTLLQEAYLEPEFP
ncbi:MAG: hypothetical protein WKF92_06500 [Pyrinomonadaceae bacterium]